MEKEIQALLEADTGTLKVNDLFMIERLDNTLYLEAISDNEAVRIASRIELKDDSPTTVLNQVNHYTHELIQNIKKDLNIGGKL